ncbi:unnamed protein product, partial [Polarella glacialis]
ACKLIPGPHVLEVKPENIGNYCCGSFDLIERDVAAVLSPGLANEALALLRSLGLPEAFQMREELVNYKKVLLHVHQQSSEMEVSLNQLTAFFRDDRERCAGGFSKPTARLGELSDVRTQCKGRCKATYDARLLGKHICNLPRHPSKPRPSGLEGLPQSLGTWAIGAAALKGTEATTPTTPATQLIGAAALKGTEITFNTDHSNNKNHSNDNNNNNKNSSKKSNHSNDNEHNSRTCDGGKLKVAPTTSTTAAISEATPIELAPIHATPIDVTATQAQPADITHPTTSSATAETDLANECSRPLQYLQGQSESVHAKVVREISSQAWPEHVREFLRLVVVSRGGDKALRMRDELRRAIEALAATLAQAEARLAQAETSTCPREAALAIEAEAEVQSQNNNNNLSLIPLTEKGASPPKESPQEDAEADAADGTQRRRLLMAAAMLRQRRTNLLTGCMPPLRESLHWMRAIEEVASSGGSRLFVAGDGRGVPATRYGARPEAPPAMCTPSGFQGGAGPEDLRFKRVLLQYGQQMRHSLATHGWPEHLVSRLGASEDSSASASASAHAKVKTCRDCQRGFSALWVHGGVCVECQETARSEGRCPFGVNCKASWFCKHALRCFICDAHACDECRFSRGDGEHVLNCVASQRPTRIALDFDRTIAMTRTGAAPEFGKHGVDTELLSLLCLHGPRCVIVTRNSHREEIRAFLAAHGSPADVPVHVVKRPASKAEHVLAGLSTEDGEERVLFVDDSIAELVDPALAADERVHRILFVRGLL